MYIPIKVNRDFERTLLALSEQYGENFEILNGIHESQLNFSDFIDGFIDRNVADVTIDCYSCSFKCDKLSGRQVCQNGALANSPNIKISVGRLVERYLNNPLSNAVVFGGLEPFEDIDNVVMFIDMMRSSGNNDDSVIYTGYTEEEITIN